MNDKVMKSLNVWKEALLDTTKRNRAINFRNLKTGTINVIYPEFSDFLNQVERSTLSFVDIFDGLDKEKSIEEGKDFVLSSGLSIEKKEEYNDEEMSKLASNYLMKNTSKKNFLFSSYFSDVQRSKLRRISNQARLFEEENALNVLFLAVGILEWYEKETSDIKYRSPLFFIPVSITQQSIQDLHELKLRENDIILNESLIRFMFENFRYDFEYKLSSDNSILDNYNEYKEYILEVVKSSPRWSIVEEINISTFKFNNINMVKDFEENESEILDHELIKMLAGEETEQGINNDSFRQAEEVDKLKDPNDFFQVLDADSSQSVAIDAAITGKSFVLQGPPGTGKSQTITNIISELIARNKKVLFVAEKKAALDVVYNSLDKVGLADYALTLHNVGLDKKETINDLHNSLISRQTNYATLHNSTKEELKNSYVNNKNVLDRYGISLLEKRNPLHKSVYELYGLYFNLEKYKEIRFHIKDIESINNEKLKDILLEINELENLINSFNGNIKGNVWYGLKLNEISYLQREELDNYLSSMLTSIKEIKISLNSIDSKLNKKINNFSLNKISQFLELIEMIKVTLVRDYNFEKYYFNNDYRLNIDYDHYKIILNNKINIKELSQKVKNYDLDILNLNVSNFYRVFNSKKNIFSRMFSGEYRKIKKEVIGYQKDRNKSYKVILSDLNNLKLYKDNEYDIEKSKELISQDMYSHLEIDGLTEVTNNMKTYIDIISMYNNIFNENDYKEFIYIITNEFKSLDVFEELDGSSNNLHNIVNKIDETYIEMTSLLDKNFYNFESEVINFSKNKKYINEMINFNRLYDKFKELHLSQFVDVVLDELIRSNLEEIYLRRHYFILVNNYIEKDEILRDFNRNKYLEYKSRFKDTDEKIISTSTLKVSELLNSNVPNITGLGQHNHEVQTLQREHNKKRRIMPIRKLFDEIPNLILTLKPCLMMSPLSVSTFLRTSDYKFDTVIFDEASQVHPQNAIGALYRSKQFIIVGDSKQLPPTIFFSSIDSGEDDIDTDVGNFESILDIASSALPQISLQWHYRSKFEELIAPSNAEMYGNLLTTYPQPNAAHKREGLEFEKVDGLYEKSENKIEAERVIELIFEHFDNFGHERSLGVVTFNIQQANLIEDMLVRERRERPEYEEYFSYDDKIEPFFIKNLENVQGDERDTMIMSVTYGPNKHGRILMNFGPINRVGGNRRLNVAITRAKYNLIIVSSMTHDDIDLSRAKGDGPAFFKNILKYAELGFDDKVDSVDVYAEFDSPFEEEVYREIVQLGYKVHPQVGTSGYKIDLGVLDPNNDNKYILGIECDGASYHSSKSARERDRLRQQVLESRGWTIHRIWSTDWFANKSLQVDLLKKVIEESIIKSENGKKQDANKPHITDEVEGEVEKIEIKTSIVEAEIEEAFETYPDYERLKDRMFGFYNRNQALEFILEKTTPIHMNEIKKIIPGLYGNERYSNVVDDSFKYDLRMSGNLRSNYHISRNFVLKRDQVIVFRQVTDYRTSRDFTNMHLEELKHGILKIVEAANIIRLQELQDTLRNYSGYQSTSRNMRNHMTKALNELSREDKISISSDDMISLRNRKEE